MALHDHEQAFECLEDAASEYDPNLPLQLRWPLFDALRDSPRFVALNERVFGR